MNRNQILTLFTEMRSSCPNSNSICENVKLKRTANNNIIDQEEFDLELKWNPDEPSLTFLKKYAIKHSLRIKTTGKTLTIHNSN
jgi:hypothetical protein